MIYLLHAQGTHYYKIGFTDTDVERRKASLQTGCPFRLVIASSIPGDKRMEIQIHQRWAKYKSDAMNEWYIFPPQIIESVLETDFATGGKVVRKLYFREWLKEQQDRDDPIGDFARDTLDYTDWHGNCPLPNNRAGWKEWRDFLFNVGVDDLCANAFDDAWTHYMYSGQEIGV